MPDTPTRPTLLQRVVMWILHASMFYVVALYPVLLMARFQPDDVVHYGFLRWIAVVLILYWAALQLFFTERPVDTRPGRQTLAVIAAMLLLIGIFMPIVSFSFIGDVSFFRDGYGDGYILLIMAVLSVALAVTGRWKQVLVPALGSLAVVLWTFLGVQDTISEARSGGTAPLAGNPHEGLAPATMASIQWEWGWVLLFAGSGLLVYAAARKDRPEPEYQPVSVAADDQPESVGETPAAETAPAIEEAPPPGIIAEPVEDPAVESAPTAAPLASAVEASTDQPAAEASAAEPATEPTGHGPEAESAAAAEPETEAPPVKPEAATTPPAAESADAPAEAAGNEETEAATAADDESGATLARAGGDASDAAESAAAPAASTSPLAAVPESAAASATDTPTTEAASRPANDATKE